MKNTIIIAGARDFFVRICETINEKLNANFIECEKISDLYRITDENCNIAAILVGDSILLDESDFAIINAIYGALSYIPIVGINKELPDKSYLKKCYTAGIVDHILEPKDELDIDLIVQKLKILLSNYKYRMQLESEIEKNALINNKLIHNSAKYLELLNSTKTAYVILDKNGCIIESNSSFIDMLKCESETEIIGHRPIEWIPNCDLKIFEEMWENMISGKTVDDCEIRFVKPCNGNKFSIWVRITGTGIQNGKFKILWLLKEITDKKNIELRDKINVEKQKDKILQNVSKIRKIISDANKSDKSDKSDKSKKDK